MALDWLKKNRLKSVDDKRLLIDPCHPNLGITRQCTLIGLSRSSDYHTTGGVESEENLNDMRLIDEQSLRTPFYGSRQMTRCLIRQGHAVNISMDGRSRVLDNVFIERLWRSVKYEDIYLKDYQNVLQLHQGLEQYFYFHNHERPHSALDGLTPAQVHFSHECRIL